MAHPFDAGRLATTAQHKEDLRDWGPLPFEEPLEVLADSYAAADLNDIGVHILRSGLVHSLRMRLRAQEWIRRHPEITEEQIVAPIVVVGMMRSGTTLLQRLLAADNRFHCAYGWEVVEVAPKLDYHWSAQDDPRIAISEKREATSRELAPELFAIHPMYAREPEEEIVFLSDAFLSHVPESGAHVPQYRSWIDEQDFAPAYAYLHRMLQFLQWQKRQRGRTAQRWVLKSPAHLGYLDTLARPVPRSAPRAHAPRPAGTRFRRAPASTPPCTRCTPTTSTVTASAPSGSSGWAGPTTERWRLGDSGPTTTPCAPTSSSTMPSPIRSVRWPACTTRSACR